MKVLKTPKLLDTVYKFVYNFVTMITSQNVRTVTDMRKRANELLELVIRSKEPVGIFKNNRLKAYLVDPQSLEMLETIIEDYLDLRMVNERLGGNRRVDFRKFEEFWKKANLPK